MTPEDPNVRAWLEPELEARLVASLLGESSAFEEAELERLLAERPEVAVFQRRLQAVHGLLGEASTQGPDSDWKLSKERRSTVLEAIRGRAEKDEKIAVASSKPSRKSFWYGAAAVASVALFVGTLTVTHMTGVMSAGSVAATRETEKSSYFGIEAKTLPQSGPDGYTVDREQAPETVEFEGFANYQPDSSSDRKTDRLETLSRGATATEESLGEVALIEATPKEQEELLTTTLSFAEAAPRIDSIEATPEIITRSGAEAKIAATRDWINPEESDPPELYQDVSVEDGIVAAPVPPRQLTWDFEPNDDQPSESSGLRLSEAQTQTDKLALFAKQDTKRTLDDSGIKDTPSNESYQVGGALTSVEKAFPDPDSQRSEWNSNSLSEEEPEPYADFATDDDSSFGQIAGINLIGRNRGNQDTLTRQWFEEDQTDAIQLGIDSDATNFDSQPTDTSTAPSPPESQVKVEDFGFAEKAPGQHSGSEQIVEHDIEKETLSSLASALDQASAQVDSPEAKLLAEQEVKVEEARLGMLDLTERYRVIDFAAMQNRPSQTGDPATEFETLDSAAENEKGQRYAKAKQTYEEEKQNLRKLEEEWLGKALAQEGTEWHEAILQEQLDKLAAQENQVAKLGQRYDILRRQNETVSKEYFFASEDEAKKDTSMDDHRKLEEYNEAAQLLEFRRKLVEKAKRALEPTKPQTLNEKHAKQEPFSTFSLHVSDVAFKLAKAALLEQNQWPEVAKVRIEEFVNAFDYGDPAPSQAEKVACQIEQAAHPFHQQRNVLRVSMRTAEIGRFSGTPLQITLLLDTSGSMERVDRQESIDRAMQVLTSQLTPNDTVTLIGFARQPRLIQDRLTGEALANLPTYVKQTPSEGGTNLEEALLLGATHARRQFVKGGQNRIVLITDGAANLGDADAESLRSLIVGLRQEGIAFDACGVGAEGLNDTVLEALTRDGDGRYYLLNKPEDADAGFARQLAGAFRPAASNVKVQVRFNDQRVGNYRLLGFEKHRLKKEDFRNDNVDAAEMASAEAGVALYEIEPLPQGDGEIGEVSVRFRDMSTGQMVERTWPIGYDARVPLLEEAAPSLQLASTAAFLGEKLKRTTFGQMIDLEQLSQTLTHLRQCYSSSQRVTDLIAMIAKAKNLQ